MAANRPARDYGQIMIRLIEPGRDRLSLLEHDLSGKPVPAFPVMRYVRSTATTDATAAINASTVAMANHMVCRRASCRS